MVTDNNHTGVLNRTHTVYKSRITATLNDLSSKKWYLTKLCLKYERNHFQNGLI